jgi:hypothetical protein
MNSLQRPHEVAVVSLEPAEAGLVFRAAPGFQPEGPAETAAISSAGAWMGEASHTRACAYDPEPTPPAA